MSKELLVIGGGAAGFFTAVNAARMHPGLKITIVEKAAKLLSKVRISGGGRCNVTHACFDINDMSRRYPRGGNYVKKMFHQFFTTDTVKWFNERGVELKTENDGRMFPVTDSSQTIIDCLLREANQYGVSIVMNYEVKSVVKNDEGFIIASVDGRTLKADCVCIACGGYPKSSMFEWLRKLGHTIQDPVPSLFTFNSPANPITSLMGLSVDNAVVKISGSKLQEAGPVLITHWGLSGPAVIRLSAWGARELAAKNYHFTASVNWVAGQSEQQVNECFQALRQSAAAQKIESKNLFQLPHRLWEFLISESGIKDEWRWADLPSREQHKLSRNLVNFELVVKGKTTFKEEFVTAGGITLSEVDHHTLQSKKVKGLYFAGEILDVDGVTGGYNFQHAWTSGYIVASHVQA